MDLGGGKLRPFLEQVALYLTAKLASFLFLLSFSALNCFLAKQERYSSHPEELPPSWFKQSLGICDLGTGPLRLRKACFFKQLLTSVPSPLPPVQAHSPHLRPWRTPSTSFSVTLPPAKLTFPFENSIGRKKNNFKGPFPKKSSLLSPSPFCKLLPLPRLSSHLSYFFCYIGWQCFLSFWSLRASFLYSLDLPLDYVEYNFLRVQLITLSKLSIPSQLCLGF